MKTSEESIKKAVEDIETLQVSSLMAIMVEVLNFDQNMFFKSYWKVKAHDSS